MQAHESGGGVMPRLDCSDLLASLPQLAGLARISATTLCLLPSASLDFVQLMEALRWAKTRVEEGADAVILTQGTDSLEEAAYFLDLLWPHEAPLVLTGAMRASDKPGADGPANLLAAVQVALAVSSRGRGVQVVMNDQIHAAARVRKVDSLAMATFSSPGFGPEGVMVEGQPCYLRAPVLRTVLPEPVRAVHKVALLEACLAADASLLERVLEAGYEGLVVAGFGAGHVSQAWAQCLEAIATRLPVVVASRTGSGSTAQASYGFTGGEMDLQAKGIVLAGFLCPRKCRVLLWLLLGSHLQAHLPSHLPKRL
ncbi:asparaginase [Pseudomonas capeferrum]|nr:asparaginase [Pseudomonas capeferrum]